MTASPAAAQEAPVVVDRMSHEQITEDWRDCGLRKIEVDANVSHRLPRSKRRAVSANIEVDYGDGFTPEAQAAFERAVEIWEAHVWSPVTIRIDARFEAQEDETLGGARSNLLYAVDRDGDEQVDTVYGDALVDALLGEDQNPRESNEPAPPDIVATFNSSRDDWHFGAGDAPPETIDFTTIVLHEITHGLNYFDIFEYDEGEGRYGFDWDGNGSVDADEKFAGVFGKRVVQEEGTTSFVPITDRTAFPTPSFALGDALTSEQLFFDAAASARAANESAGPVPPKLFAPDEFEEGSSVAHLDEASYSPRTLNALMTPQINRAETVRRTGPLVCGQIADMGWTVGAACALEEVAIDIVAAEPRTDGTNQGAVDLTWHVTGDVEVESFVVEHQYFDQSVQRETVPADGAGEYSATIDGLGVGEHTFRIIYVTEDEMAVQSGASESVTVNAERPEITVYPDPFFDVARVSFVLPERQRVRVEVYDALGRHVATPFADEREPHDPRPVVFRSGRLPDLGSGVYFFRVVGDTFTQTVRATHIR